MLVKYLQVKLTGTVSKEELGRSTWTFLHTLAAQVPLNSSLWPNESLIYGEVLVPKLVIGN